MLRTCTTDIESILMLYWWLSETKSSSCQWRARADNGYKDYKNLKRYLLHWQITEFALPMTSLKARQDLENRQNHDIETHYFCIAGLIRSCIVNLVKKILIRDCGAFVLFLLNYGCTCMSLLPYCICIIVFFVCACYIYIHIYVACCVRKV